LTTSTQTLEREGRCKMESDEIFAWWQHILPLCLSTSPPRGYDVLDANLREYLQQRYRTSQGSCHVSAREDKPSPDKTTSIDQQNEDAVKP
jgi:hypothetical protein